jgi:hypothetical protein
MTELQYCRLKKFAVRRSKFANCRLFAYEDSLLPIAKEQTIFRSGLSHIQRSTNYRHRVGNLTLSTTAQSEPVHARHLLARNAPARMPRIAGLLPIVDSHHRSLGADEGHCQGQSSALNDTCFVMCLSEQPTQMNHALNSPKGRG